MFEEGKYHFENENKYSLGLFIIDSTPYLANPRLQLEGISNSIKSRKKRGEEEEEEREKTS